MGLRERNAARTREAIIDVALSLFLERGYEAATMEDVAAAAGVGTSTLYRYFPSKELLLIEPLAFRGKLADELRARPPEEQLGPALGHAIVALLTFPRGDRARMARIRQVVDSAPGPQMRMREEFVRERDLLERAVAERLDRPLDDVFCVLTARLAISTLEYVVELAKNFQGDDAGAEQHVRAVIDHVARQLTADPPIAPVLPPDPGAVDHCLPDD